MIRFSMRDLFALTALIAVSLGIISYYGSIFVAIHLSLCLTGWLLRRFLHGHLGGVIPALLGGDFLLCCAVGWIYRGSEGFHGLRTTLAVIASLVVLVGLVVLLWVGKKRQQFWQQQFDIATTITILLVAWWVTVPMLGNAAVARRQASDLAANEAARVRAIALVEEVRQRTGTTPAVDKLEELLREPLPSVHWDGASRQIHYQRAGDKTFCLYYLDPSDDSWFGGVEFMYNSASPDKGWDVVVED